MLYLKLTLISICVLAVLVGVGRFLKPKAGDAAELSKGGV